MTETPEQSGFMEERVALWSSEKGVRDKVMLVFCPEG